MKVFYYLFFFFLVSILPFFFNLLFHDKDTSARWGVFQIDFEKKKILFEHYLNGYLKIEFLLVFIVSIFFVYLANKKKNIKPRNYQYIFYFVSRFGICSNDFCTPFKQGLYFISFQ